MQFQFESDWFLDGGYETFWQQDSNDKYDASLEKGRDRSKQKIESAGGKVKEIL